MKGIAQTARITYGIRKRSLVSLINFCQRHKSVEWIELPDGVLWQLTCFMDRPMTSLVPLRGVTVCCLIAFPRAIHCSAAKAHIIVCRVLRYSLWINDAEKAKNNQLANEILSNIRLWLLAQWLSQEFSFGWGTRRIWVGKGERVVPWYDPQWDPAGRSRR